MAETLQERLNDFMWEYARGLTPTAAYIAQARDALDAKDAEIARLTAERDEAVNALRRAYQNATKREDTPCAPI